MKYHSDDRGLRFCWLIQIVDVTYEVTRIDGLDRTRYECSCTETDQCDHITIARAYMQYGEWGTPSAPLVITERGIAKIGLN